MEHSLWEANDHSAIQEVPCLYWNLKVNYHVHNKATKKLHLLQHKTRHVQATEDDYKKRTYFCNWFLWAVHDGVLHPKLTFFTDEACFCLSGYINAQNNRCWSFWTFFSTPSWSEDRCVMCHDCYTNNRTHIF